MGELTGWINSLSETVLGIDPSVPHGSNGNSSKSEKSEKVDDDDSSWP